jgi:hypothetical protein
MNTGGPCSGLPDSRTRPSEHSVSNHPVPSRVRRLYFPTGFPHPALLGPSRRISSLSEFGLRLSCGGSPRHQAESSSSSYGLLIHLQLLPTPPRGDAVTFGYGAETNPGVDFHHTDRVRFRAHACSRLREHVWRVNAARVQAWPRKRGPCHTPREASPNESRPTRRSAATSAIR